MSTLFWFFLLFSTALLIGSIWLMTSSIVTMGLIVSGFAVTIGILAWLFQFFRTKGFRNRTALVGIANGFLSVLGLGALIIGIAIQQVISSTKTAITNSVLDLVDVSVTGIPFLDSIIESLVIKMIQSGFSAIGM